MFGPLLADAADGRTAFLVALAGIAGSALTASAAWGWKWWRQRVADRDGREKTITDHLQAVVARQERECSDLEAKCNRLQERIDRLQERAAGLAGHARYLEAVLRTAGIKYDPWTEPDDPGSRPHRPLPEGSK